MEVIPDLQGFYFPSPDGPRFIVKELAIGALDKPEVETTIFKTPCPWQELPPKIRTTNNWLIRHHHGIPWEAGDVAYSEVKNVLMEKLESVEVIYVKGLQKKEWLRDILRSDSLAIIDMEDMSCPSLKDLHVSVCRYYTYHRFIRNHNCASENVRRLKVWMMENSIYY